MPIEDKTAFRTPPTFHFHVLTESDTVEELNAWAIGLFSPIYHEGVPAFELGDDSLIHYYDGIAFSEHGVTPGWVVLFDATGRLTAMAIDAFASAFTPSA